MKNRKYPLGIQTFENIIKGQYVYVDKTALAYELAYGKGLTPFLRLARQARPTIAMADGVGMLVEQAAEAFVWWRGVRPDTSPVISAITIPLT